MPNNASTEFYISYDGETYGPYTRIDIINWHKSGQIPFDSVLYEHEQWIPISSVYTNNLTTRIVKPQTKIDKSPERNMTQNHSSQKTSYSNKHESDDSRKKESISPILIIAVIFTIGFLGYKFYPNPPSEVWLACDQFISHYAYEHYEASVNYVTDKVQNSIKEKIVIAQKRAKPKVIGNTWYESDGSKWAWTTPGAKRTILKAWRTKLSEKKLSDVVIIKVVVTKNVKILPINVEFTDEVLYTIEMKKIDGKWLVRKLEEKNFTDDVPFGHMRREISK